MRDIPEWSHEELEKAYREVCDNLHKVQHELGIVSAGENVDEVIVKALRDRTMRLAKIKALVDSSRELDGSICKADADKIEFIAKVVA